MLEFKATAGEDNYKVDAVTLLTGRDIVAVFGGGEKYHIGACALATARESLARNNCPSATASVICITGHKEDQLARTAALELAARYNCVVNAVVGIHLAQATKEDITKLVASFTDCLSLVKKSLDEFFALEMTGI